MPAEDFERSRRKVFNYVELMMESLLKVPIEIVFVDPGTFRRSIRKERHRMNPCFSGGWKGDEGVQGSKVRILRRQSLNKMLILDCFAAGS